MLVALLAAAPASARVALLATGTNDVALLDVTTDIVVARPALPGPLAGGRHRPRRTARVRRRGQRRRRLRLRDGPRRADSAHTAAPFAVLTRDLGAPGGGDRRLAGRRERVRGRRPAPLRARRPDAGHPPSRAPAWHGARAGAVEPGDAGGRRAGQGPRGDGGDGRARSCCGGSRSRARRAPPSTPRRAPGSARRGACTSCARARASPRSTRCAWEGRGRRGGRVAGRAHPGRRRGARRLAAALVDVAGHHVRRFRSGRGPGRPVGRPTAFASTTPTAAAPRSRW